MALDIFPGPTGSYPTDLTNVNGTLFFAADDPLHGVEPWELGPLPVAPASISVPITALAGAAFDPGPATSDPRPARPPNSPAPLLNQGVYLVELETGDPSTAPTVRKQPLRDQQFRLAKRMPTSQDSSRDALDVASMTPGESPDVK